MKESSPIPQEDINKQQEVGYLNCNQKCNTCKHVTCEKEIIHGRFYDGINEYDHSCTLHSMRVEEEGTCPNWELGNLTHNHSEESVF
jgi:hypothetical protein